MAKSLIFNFDGMPHTPSVVTQKQPNNSVHYLISNILKFHLFIGGSLKLLNVPLQDGSRSYYYPSVGSKKGADASHADTDSGEYHVADILNKALNDFENTYYFEPVFEYIVITGFGVGAGVARRFAYLINNKVPKNSIFMCVIDTLAYLDENISEPELKYKAAVFENGGNLAQNVAHALHILALDESSSKLSPRLISQVDNRVTELWFPGTHADLGGGQANAALSDNCLRFLLDWFEELDLGIYLLSAKTINYEGLFDVGACDVIGPDDMHLEPDVTTVFPLFAEDVPSSPMACYRRCVVEGDKPHKNLPLVHHSVAQCIHFNKSYRPKALRNVKHTILYDNGQRKHFVGYSEHRYFDKRHYNLPTPLGIDTVAFAYKKNNRTRILLEKGKTYTIEVCTDSMWNDAGIRYTDGNGWQREEFELDVCELPMQALKPYRRVPSHQVNWFALCGNINADDSYAFHIGNRIQGYRPEISGELCLFANDLPGYYHNNSGKLLVRVFLVE